MTIVNDLRLEDCANNFVIALSDASGCSLQKVRNAMKSYLYKCDNWSSGDRTVAIYKLGLSSDEVSELQKPCHITVEKF